MTDSRDEYFAARTKQAATEVYQLTGDEWNARTRLRTIEDGGKLNPDQARFARQCVEDLGRAEWLVRKDRDAIASRLRAVEAENAALKKDSAHMDFLSANCSSLTLRDSDGTEREFEREYFSVDDNFRGFLAQLPDEYERVTEPAAPLSDLSENPNG